MIRELKEENKKLKEMLSKLAKASATGQPVDLKKLGITNLEEVVENMEENEKILDDMQKPHAQKLAEAKAADAANGDVNDDDDMDFGGDVNEGPDFDQLISEKPADRTERMSMAVRESRAAKRPANDLTVPHLLNLHEDPMQSGIIYYSLQKGELHIGRRNGEPKPEIILGSMGVKSNHAKISLIEDKGLFQIQASEAEAAQFVIVNGQLLATTDVVTFKRTLNHLDRIIFPGGVTYIFHYPLLANAMTDYKEANPDASLEQAFQSICESGISDFSQDNMKAELKNKEEQKPDWDLAFAEYE